jgi:hypothetical protein
MTDQEQLAGYDHGTDRTPELSRLEPRRAYLPRLPPSSGHWVAIAVGAIVVATLK